MDISNQPIMQTQKQAQGMESDLLRLLLGPIIQRSICFVTAIHIPDLLADHSHSAAQPARKTKNHTPSLYRVLRALAGSGIFKLRDDGKFEMSPMAELLRSDGPNSMR